MKIARKVLGALLVLVLLSGNMVFVPGKTDAALATTSSVLLSDSRASGTSVGYTITFTFPGTTSIKCIDIIFGDTTGHITLSANPATTIPTSMVTTSAAKGTISGGGLTDGNYTLYNTVNGILQLEDPTGHTSTATSVTIPITGITNTSSGTFYAQVATYSTLSTHTCSGLVDNTNIMALGTTAGIAASVTVDPTVSFSVANSGAAVNGSGDSSPVTTTSTTVPFGTVAAGATAWGSHTLTVSTNASHGYNLYARYTAALTDANNDTVRGQACTSSDCTLAANAMSFDGSTSQSSFAYTTDNANVVLGSNKWLGFTTTNTKVASSASAVNADATHAEYKVEISNTQPPGTYTTTLVYNAAPTY